MTSAIEAVIKPMWFFTQHPRDAAPWSSLFLKIWLLFPNAAIIHTLQLATIVLSGIIFAFLVRRVTRSLSTAYLSIAILCTTLQYRTWHDGILGTSLDTTFPTLLLLYLAYLISDDDIAPHHKWIDDIKAACTVIVASLTAFWTLPVIAAIMFIKSKATRVYLPVFAFVATIGVYVTCLVGRPMPMPFVRLSTDIASGAYVVNILREWFAALPTTFRATGNVVRDGISNSNNDVRFINVLHAGLMGWILTLALGLLVYGCLTRSKQINSERPFIPFALALALWLAPALFGVLTPGSWENGLPWGMAFDTVYASYYGVALVLTLLLQKLISFIKPFHWKDAVTLTVSCACALITYGNIRMNNTVESIYETRDVPRRELLQASAKGLFDKIPLSAPLSVAANYPFSFETEDYRDAKYFFAGIAHRNIAVLPAQAIESGGVACLNTSSSICVPKKLGIYFLQVSSASKKPPKTNVLAMKWVQSIGHTVFGDYAVGYASSTIALAAKPDPSIVENTNHGYDASSTEFPDGSALFTSTRRCGPVPSQRIFFPDNAQISWGNGFYPYQTYPSVQIVGAREVYDRPEAYRYHARFAQRNASIDVVRDRCARLPMIFTTRVFSDVPAELTVTTAGGVQHVHVSQDGVIINLPIPTSLPDRFSIAFSTNASDAAELLLPPRTSRSKHQSIALYIAEPEFRFAQ